MSDTDDFWPKKGDKLFLTAGHSDDIGCLSWPTLDHYANCFYLSARSLAEAALNERTETPMDGAIYPIVFMYGHYIELSLKAMIFVLNRLETDQRGFPDDHHNLKRLWDEARPLLVQHYSPRIVPGMEGMDGCISDINANNPNSIPFRFPFDRKGNPSLQNLHNINLRNLYETMEKVSHFLDCMLADLDEHFQHMAELQRESQYQ